MDFSYDPAVDAGPHRLVESFRVLSHPVRWAIVQRLAGHEELAWGQLYEALPVAESTASHHTKILLRAGLLTIRKDGRNVHYGLRSSELRAVVDELAAACRPPEDTPADLPPVGTDTVRSIRSLLAW